ncbi:hypothetical protein ACVMIX_004345 [Rhizobium leguminosarum]
MNWLLGFLFGVVLDVALAVGLAMWDGRPDKAFMFLMALLVLWIVPLGVSFWGVIKFWLSYALFGKRRIVRYYKAEMYKSKFPTTNGFADWQSYIDYLITEDGIATPIKIKAAAFASEIQTYKTLKPATIFIGLQMALDRAMEEYQAPPSTSGMFASPI